jgi:hypothetical protein
MVKDFNDFKKTISEKDFKLISNQITEKLNATTPSLDVFEYERSFNLSLTMRLLEEYHKWLNN